MARFKNTTWNCGDDAKCVNVDFAQLAVLMDIRDELQTLNRLLHCSNFTGMPRDLRQINRRLAETIKLKKGRIGKDKA